MKIEFAARAEVGDYFLSVRSKMGLLPLEFSDCLVDSPYFRENLKQHEKTLDQVRIYGFLETLHFIAANLIIGPVGCQD